MFQQPVTISRRFFALLLICIFAMAITPAMFFHNMLAGHHDENIEHHHKRTNEIAKASINCHWDNMVCEQSFLNNSTVISIATPFFCEAKPIASYSAFFTQHHFYAELRGPPAIA